MQLYKKRNFSDLFSDTFDFFKKYGKNYFKNYFAINGVLLILIMVLVGVGFRDILSQFFNSNMGNESYYFEEYFSQNLGFFLVICFLLIALFIIFSVINYTYPVVYLDLLGKQNKKEFAFSEITDVLKQNIGKMFIFMLFFMFIIFPLAFLVLIIGIGLSFILIGIPLLILSYPIILNIINFTLYDYLLTNNGIFISFQKAFSIQFSNNFWKYVGSPLVLYIIIQSVVSIFSFIPAFVMGFGSAMAQEGGLDDWISILVIVLYMLSILVSLILTNSIYVNAGLMYFDSREDLHQQVHFEEIESIGQNHA